MRHLSIKEELDLHREIGRIEGNARILKRIATNKNVSFYADDILEAIEAIKQGVFEHERAQQRHDSVPRDLESRKHDTA